MGVSASRGASQPPAAPAAPVGAAAAPAVWASLSLRRLFGRGRPDWAAPGRRFTHAGRPARPPARLEPAGRTLRATARKWRDFVGEPCSSVLGYAI